MLHPTEQLTVPVSDLAVHPLLRNIWLESDDDAALLRHADNLADVGIQERIKITPSQLIVDGRRRWKAARLAGLTEVPVEVVPEEDAASIIVSVMVHRRHLTAEQTAYMLVGSPILEEAFEAAKLRRAGNSCRNKAALPTFTAKLPEDWAKEIGVSVEYLRTARRLHEEFWTDTKRRTMTDQYGKTERSVTFREFFEPRIMSAMGYGIGAVVAGCKARLEQDRLEAAGQPHGGGRPDELQRQLELFTEPVRKLANQLEKRMQYWHGLTTEAHRRDALAPWVVVFEKLPDDMLDRLEKQIEATKKTRAQAKKK
jgi:hypothetical protein